MRTLMSSLVLKHLQPAEWESAHTCFRMAHFQAPSLLPGAAASAADSTAALLIMALRACSNHTESVCAATADCNRIAQLCAQLHSKQHTCTSASQVCIAYLYKKQ
jgi:hypothetical protein